ncbi:PE-PGRS family protein [Peterkaempfera bronchialis]|uniref:PE-PGRS family protein n=1 Tax=Peterkaempfera bronchialis TaxID=2126346 RepID=A0A345T618_9ACTN|nr:PE-PGRS family protein [Peterkaempfera bronchialis]
MLRWSPLNERQLSLLTRIGGDGSPVTSDESELAHSARALKERGLISMPKAVGVKWRAEINDAGRFYLEHGYHPDRPTPKPKTVVRSPADPAPQSRPAETGQLGDKAGTRAPAVRQQPKESRAVSGPALIEQVRQAGRFLTIPDPAPEERARLRRAFDAARKCAPEGYQLKYSGREKGDFYLGLLRDNGLDETEWNRIRLQRSRVITDVDAVLAALEADPSAFEVSDDVLPRVLSITRLIADEAVLRRGDVAVSKKRKQPRPLLSVHGRTWELSFKERQKQVKFVPQAQGRRKTYDWQRVTPAYRSEPSGELELQVIEQHSGYGYGSGWKKDYADTAKRSLEEQIGTLFRALKAHAEEQERLQLERQAEQRRLREERERAEAERQRLAAEEKARRQRDWEGAVSEASLKAVEASRLERFGSALDRWRGAREIREFCAALDEAASRADDAKEAQRFREWSAWGRAEADRIDPTALGSGLGNEAFETVPTADALRPFLNGWSPHRPEKEAPPAEPAQPRQQADPWRDISASPRDQGWRHGPQGRAQWWRR